METSPDGKDVAIWNQSPLEIIVHSLRRKQAPYVLGGGVTGNIVLLGWNSSSSDIFVLRDGYLETAPANGGPITFRRPFSDAQYGPLTVSPNSQQLIEYDPSDIRIASLAQGRVERSIALPDHAQGSRYVTDPDDSYLAVELQLSRTSIKSSAEVIDLSTGQAHIVGSGNVDTITFGGGHLLIQRADGTMEIWDKTGRVLQHAIHQDASYLAGNGTNPILIGSLLVQERSNGAVVITDISTGDVIGSLPRLAALEMALAADRRGDRLITVAPGPVSEPTAGELAQWSLSSGTWIRAACTAAGRSLTAADMRSFAGMPSPGFLACSS